ncbi:BZIP domain-containing protein [Meloidogyne graminicola]|uniref:BZIP domain-containing protein n=1 Tax=Meloidogyne graminicola TaxID=189291 RepID=A0A8S9ZQG5_9BILA|nr:BZIP domain-containing protein [Meloidogyne graminicola]KAF7635706.1 BZIP domain-containing protein [Meloidogyne graminicola]
MSTTMFFFFFSSSLYSPIQTNNEYQQHFRVYVDPKTYFQNNLSPVSPSIIAQDSPSNILGQQMNRLELDFNLQNETIIQNNQIKHQEEIYQEIVSECRALEQQQNCENNREELNEGIINNTLKESSMLTTELITPTSFHPLSTTLTKINSNNLNFQLNNDPKQQSLFLPSNSPSQQQLINENLNNNNNFVGLSLEHLVKVLVQTVKEVTGNSTTKLINNNVQQKEKNEKEIIPIYDETAEQILERRRKQVNLYIKVYYFVAIKK